MEEEKKTTEELQEEIARLQEENEQLKAYRASLPPKERVYDRIPLTLRQMDVIIGLLLTLLVGVIVMGIITR